MTNFLCQLNAAKRDSTTPDGYLHVCKCAIWSVASVRIRKRSKISNNMQIRLMPSNSLSIWFLVCLPVCLSLIPHPLPTFPTIAYRILIINFVYFISLSYAQVSMSQSLFIKGKDGQQNIWERVLWSGGTKKGSKLLKICGFQLICTIFAGESKNYGLERLRRRFQYLMRILTLRTYWASD